MKKGKLIVIEGACDGIGKSTQYDLLYKYFIDNKMEVVKHHFPTYDTEQGLLVQKYLAGEFGSPKELSPYFINSLYAIDRTITWNTRLKKEYESGKIILLDRYVTSSLIYQSALMNKSDKDNFIKYVEDYEYNKLGLKKPDLVIFLDANFDVVTNLRNKRKDNEGVENDVYERNLDLMKKIYDNSKYVSEKLNFKKVLCSDDKSMRKIEDINKDILKIVKSI